MTQGREIIGSRFWNSQISTDLFRQQVANLRMTWDSGPATIGGIQPPRMLCAFTSQDATMSRKMGNQIPPFHAPMLTSS